MAHPVTPAPDSHYARVGWGLCIAGAAIGALGLLGWFAGLGLLTTVVPGEPSMKPNTAVALLSIGVAGALRHPAGAAGGWRKAVAFSLALVVLAAGAGTLAEYALGVDLGIDRLIAGSEPGPYPGRPSPPTALALTLLATAVLILDVRPTARARPAEWLILSAALTAFTSLAGYAFGAGPLYRLTRAPVIGVALPTAISLLLTSAGLLLERPAAGISRAVTSPGPGGILLRRLGIPAILAPMLAGAVVTRSAPALGLAQRSLLTAVLISVLTVVSLCLLAATAVPLDRTHEALESSRAWARTLVEQAPDGIFVADLGGRYTDVNLVGCRLLGYAREDIIGKTIVDLIPPEDAERLWRSREWMLEGDVGVDEWRLRRADGSYVFVEVSASILPDGRWLGFVRDVSERKQAQKKLRQAQEEVRLAEARSSGILSISADAIVSVDEGQRITLFNRGAEVIFGYSSAEVIGEPLEILIPPRFAAVHRRRVEEFAAGESVARRMGERGTAIFGLRKSGEEFPADAAISKLEVAGKKIFTVALRDVTEQQRLDEELRRAIRSRDEMLGIVAHDLRNPLSSIVMQASLLRRRGPEPERRSTRPPEAIERSALRMKRLIQDLLDVTMLEAGRFSIQRDRLAARQVVSDVVEAQRPLAASAGLELQMDLAREVPDVLADRDRLLQVFENLVGNALKLTGPGGRITVGAAPREAEVLFWVADTGPGIRGEDAPHVFDRFWQGRKAERRSAGLGLPIVKGIVEAHGGRVWFDSAPGRGTTFFFTIPAAPSSAWNASDYSPV